MSVNLGWGHRASRRWVKDRQSMADVRFRLLMQMPPMHMYVSAEPAELE